MINRSQLSKVVCKASCWDCQDFYIGKTKRRLHDRKSEHFNTDDAFRVDRDRVVDRVMDLLKYGSKSIQMSLILRQRPPKPC